MPVNAYLNFDGNCREAVEHYAEVFETEKPQFMTFGDTPANPEYPLPAEAKNLIMHARITIFGSEVMFSDVFPGMPFIVGNNISLAIVADNGDKLKSAFHKLQKDGKVVMELQETSWSKCYGSLEDKYGVQWQFNLE